MSFQKQTECAGLIKPLMLEMKNELLGNELLHAKRKFHEAWKAVTYAQNQKEYLCSFLKDGRIQLSNNLAEQFIKPFVIGRKYWLFANTPNGATASSLIYSVIQTAIANDLKPLSYLEYVFGQIQLAEDLQTEDLLPWSESIPEYCKNQNPSSSQ